MIAIGALLIAVAGYASKTLDKSLSIREHEEFRKNVDDKFREIASRQDLRLTIKTFDDWRDEFNRVTERTLNSLRILEQTRPTTGEQKAEMRGIKQRIKIIESKLVAMKMQGR